MILNVPGLHLQIEVDISPGHDRTVVWSMRAGRVEVRVETTPEEMQQFQKDLEITMKELGKDT